MVTGHIARRILLGGRSLCGGLCGGMVCYFLGQFSSKRLQEPKNLSFWATLNAIQRVPKVRFTKYGEKLIRQKMGLNCRILAFTIDRWMQLDERHRLDVFSGASQTWPLFSPLQGGFATTGGYFYYREGVNSPCSGPPKAGSRHCMAVARAIISPRASQGGKIELN